MLNNCLDAHLETRQIMQSKSDYESISHHIKEMILDISNLPGYEIKDISDDMSLFGDGLGLDSIDLLEIVVALDKEYGIKLKNDKKGQEVLQNVGSLTNEVLRTTALRASTSA